VNAAASAPVLSARKRRRVIACMCAV
jgi:hypothetical protein